jgi:dolichyl-phosphate beta-glucosyltransferase
VPSYSVVVPAFNEEARIGGALTTLLAVVRPGDGELIVVDDGSSDATASIAECTLDGAAHASLLRLSANTGKGAAIRAGVLAASGDAVVFMDADLASDLSDLPSLLAALDDADVVVGSRSVAGSTTIGGTPLRAVMALVFNLMARPVMRLPIRDTQCGFKAFRADAARTLFSVGRSNRFAFDIEVLTIARILGMRIRELPVTWTAVEGSHVRLVRDPLQMTADLVRIAWRCRPGAVRRKVARLDCSMAQVQQTRVSTASRGVARGVVQAVLARAARSRAVP